MILKIEQSVKNGVPVRFRGFGYENTQYTKLLEVEKSEIVIKKKNHKDSVEVARRFLKHTND
jgi:hypothetical protein